MTTDTPLEGRRLLVLEDEFFLAEDMTRGLQEQGAEVIGPAGDIDRALDLLDGTPRLDGAVLDINVRGEMAYPVADALIARRIPFVFVTGYDKAVIPRRYADVIRCEKPVSARDVGRALFGPA